MAEADAKPKSPEDMLAERKKVLYACNKKLGEVKASLDSVLQRIVFALDKGETPSNLDIDTFRRVEPTYAKAVEDLENVIIYAEGAAVGTSRGSEDLSAVAAPIVQEAKKLLTSVKDALEWVDRIPESANEKRAKLRKSFESEGFADPRALDKMVELAEQVEELQDELLKLRLHDMSTYDDREPARVALPIDDTSTGMDTAALPRPTTPPEPTTATPESVPAATPAAPEAPAVAPVSTFRDRVRQQAATTGQVNVYDFLRLSPIDRQAVRKLPADAEGRKRVQQAERQAGNAERTMDRAFSQFRERVNVLASRQVLTLNPGQVEDRIKQFSSEKVKTEEAIQIAALAQFAVNHGWIDAITVPNIPQVAQLVTAYENAYQNLLQALWKDTENGGAAYDFRGFLYTNQDWFRTFLDKRAQALARRTPGTTAAPAAPGVTPAGAPAAAPEAVAAAPATPATPEATPSAPAAPEPPKPPERPKKLTPTASVSEILAKLDGAVTESMVEAAKGQPSGNRFTAQARLGRYLDSGMAATGGLDSVILEKHVPVLLASGDASDRKLVIDYINKFKPE